MYSTERLPRRGISIAARPRAPPSWAKRSWADVGHRPSDHETHQGSTYIVTRKIVAILCPDRKCQLNGAKSGPQGRTGILRIGWRHECTSPAPGDPGSRPSRHLLW